MLLRFVGSGLRPNVTPVEGSLPREMSTFPGARWGGPSGFGAGESGVPKISIPAVGGGRCSYCNEDGLIKVAGPETTRSGQIYVLISCGPSNTVRAVDPRSRSNLLLVVAPQLKR